MSKILDLLNYKKKKEEVREEREKNFSNHIPVEDFDSDTKEKLANTYLLDPVDEIEDIDRESDKKTLSHKHDIETSKLRFAQFFPWLISFLAVVLLLVNMVYRGRINVKIEVLKGSPVQSVPNTQVVPDISKNVPEDFPLKKDIFPTTKTTLISIPLIAEGGLNRDIIKRFGFYGAALNKSRVTRDGLFLFNDGTAGWASVGLDLTEPMDLSNSTLDFFIKGGSGDESLELILRDAENNSYMPQVHSIIFNKDMGRSWQFVSASFNDFNGSYNPKRVSHIGFEFGTQTTSNEPGVSIYIRNVKIVKNPATSYDRTKKGIK